MLGATLALWLISASPGPLSRIEGRVYLIGDRPKVKALAVTKDQGFCGDHLPDDSLQLGPLGQLADAVVVATSQDASAPRPVPQPRHLVLEQRACRFVPHVLVATVGSTIDVVNGDDLLHTARATVDGSTAFNFAFPFKDLKKTIVADKVGRWVVSCDAGHTWMRSEIHVFDSEAFALTDRSGRFVLPGHWKLPARIEVRHERLKEPITVTVQDGRADLRIDVPASALGPPAPAPRATAAQVE